MANEQNLRPFTSDQNREEAKKNGQKGGRASGVAKRRKNAFRKYLQEVLAYKPEITPPIAKNLKSMGADPDRDDYTVEKIAAIALMQKIMKSDVQALKFTMEMLSEDPKTMLEKEKIKIQKEAVEAIKNSDGFLAAMTGVAEEVFADGGDTPDAIEDTE